MKNAMIWGAIVTLITANSGLTQQIYDCPNPLFECLGPGPTAPTPGNPPDPIFRPVSPEIAQSIDFNRFYGVVREGTIEVIPGSPNVGDDLANYLTRNRQSIHPNAAYAISPDSVTGLQLDGEAVIIGGGALSQ